MDVNTNPEPLVSLCNDYEHYFSCMNQFYKSISSWLPDYMKWVNTNVGRQVLDRMDVNLQPGEKLRILGIGSGNGKVEFNLISRLLTKHPAIHNTVVEPSSIHVNLYKNLMEEKRDELKGVEFDFREETLSEYKQSCEKTRDTTKYHIISAFFSLYYETEMNAMLAYMYDLLAPGGVLLVAMESETCDLIRVESQFKFAQDDRNPAYSSREVRDYFEKCGISYANCKNEDTHHDFDITNCFDDTDPNCDPTLDLLSSVINFRKSVSPEVLEEFRDYLKGIASQREGKVFLRRDTDHIIATK